jgi:lactocepin
MAEIVSEGWSDQTGGTVVVATGEGFKDALAAAGLAGLDGGPVVLTAGKSLSRQAETQLKALKPSKVYVAGGTFAVSDGVLSAIQRVTGVRPERVFGQTSASTSAALAKAGGSRWGGTAIIATNKSFKDALSVAPISYAKHWPILLADNGKSLNADVIKALKDCGIRRAYIVGGTAAVTPNVEKQLRDNGVELAERLAGKNGVETSRKIADFALDNGLTVANMAFATSQNFPDALAGAALCGRNGSVLLLCDDKAPGNLSFATDHASGIQTGYVFGGNLAFSDKLMESLPR